ncbi:hypothetical protein TcCL_NonESM11063 [Trypanosoma cruzi]|nr:hypothetical protein TcCL_NonESM11063 [Trypanosoma cruzi]
MTGEGAASKRGRVAEDRRGLQQAGKMKMMDEGEIKGEGSRKQAKNIVSTTLFLAVGDRRPNWLLIYPLKVTPVSAGYAACISVGLFVCLLVCLFPAHLFLRAA